MVFRGKILALAAMAALLFVSDVVAQRGGNPFSRGTSLLELLANESVQEYLEMSDDQIAEIEIIVEDSRERRGDAMAKIREEFQSGDRESAFKMAREIMGELTEEDEKGVEEMLVGDQLETLQRIRLQQDLKGRNPAGALDRLLDMVEATDDEKEKFKEVSVEIDKETRKKIEKLVRQSVTQKFQESLTAAKAKKAEKILGDMIEGLEIERGGFRGRGDGGNDF